MLPSSNAIAASAPTTTFKYFIFPSRLTVPVGALTTPAIVGRIAFHDRIKGIIERMTSIEFRVVDTLTKGPLVLNERHDTLVSAQRTRRFHAVGMFFLVNGKIVEWTDYVISES